MINVINAIAFWYFLISIGIKTRRFVNALKKLPSDKYIDKYSKYINVGKKIAISTIINNKNDIKLRFIIDEMKQAKIYPRKKLIKTLIKNPIVHNPINQITKKYQ